MSYVETGRIENDMHELKCDCGHITMKRYPDTRKAIREGMVCRECWLKGPRIRRRKYLDIEALNTKLEPYWLEKYRRLP